MDAGRAMPPRARRDARAGRLAAGLWGALVAADRRMRMLAALLLGLTLVSTAVFARFAHLALVDAIYFTVTIITTTGFGDINLLAAPTPLKLYGMALMLLGATALAV